MNILEELKRQPPGQTKRRGSGRQAFLARRAEIAQALKDGHPAKAVWQVMYDKGLMPIQYRTFIDYVNRYIQPTPEKDENTNQVEKKSEVTKQKKQEPQTEDKTSRENEPKQLKADLVKRFEHNPSAKPDDELF